MTTVKDANVGAISTKKYDAGDRVIEEIDALDGYTRYAYDPDTGKLKTKERGKYVVDAAGTLLNETTYTYDRLASRLPNYDG